MGSVVRAFFLFLLLAGLALCGAANAKVEAQVPSIAAKSPEGKTVVEEVCYPEALTEFASKLGAKAPCAPKNYIFSPLQNDQSHVFHDRSGIWTDQELKRPTPAEMGLGDVDLGPGGVNIWENTVKNETSEATLSMIVDGSCTMLCPAKLRVRTPGKPDLIKNVDGICPSETYQFIRNDFKALLACGVFIPLE